VDAFDLGAGKPPEVEATCSLTWTSESEPDDLFAMRRARTHLEQIERISGEDASGATGEAGKGVVVPLCLSW
jgi:hypothetical protein